MADWALSDYSRVEVRYATSARSGTPHAKGAWAEVIGATSFAYDRLEVQMQFWVGGNTTALCDIGIGASGSETVVVPNVFIGGVQPSGGTFSIPYRIPAGSRIAVRHQEASTPAGTRSVIWAVSGFGGGFKSEAPRSLRADAYGVSTATSLGTSVSPNATANVFGSWTEIVSATSRRHSCLLLCVGNDSLTVTSRPNSQHRTELAIGGAGSEAVIGSHIAPLNGAYCGGGVVTVPIPVAAGARLSVRTMSTATSNPPLWAAVIGL